MGPQLRSTVFVLIAIALATGLGRLEAQSRGPWESMGFRTVRRWRSMVADQGIVWGAVGLVQECEGLDFINFRFLVRLI
jgi:hypothetical protein